MIWQFEGNCRRPFPTFSARCALRKSGACFGMLVQFKPDETITDRIQIKARILHSSNLDENSCTLSSLGIYTVLKSTKPSPTQAPVTRSSWKNKALMGRFWGFAEFLWVPDRADPSPERGLRDLEELRQVRWLREDLEDLERLEDPDPEDLEDGLRALEGFFVVFPSLLCLEEGSLSKVWSKEANFSCSSSKASLVVC